MSTTHDTIWARAAAALAQRSGGSTPRTRRRLGLQTGQLRKLDVGRQSYMLKRSPYAVKEALALREVGLALPAALRGSVPDLALDWSEEQLIATERLPGRPLGELLTLAVSPLGWPLRRRACSAVEGAGRWLATFHAHGETAGCLAAERADLVSRLAGPLSLPRALAEQLLARFDALTADTAGRCGLVHGDFTPRNILLAPEGAVGVIDWEMCEARPRPLLYDYHFFLVTLHKRRFDPGASAAAVERLASAFERGYRSCCPPIDPSADAAARLLATLTVADRQAKALPRGRLWTRAPRRAHLRWLQARLVADLSGDQTRSSHAR